MAEQQTQLEKQRTFEESIREQLRRLKKAWQEFEVEKVEIPSNPQLMSMAANLGPVAGLAAAANMIPIGGLLPFAHVGPTFLGPATVGPNLMPIGHSPVAVSLSDSSDSMDPPWGWGGGPGWGYGHGYYGRPYGYHHGFHGYPYGFHHGFHGFHHGFHGFHHGFHHGFRHY